ncbi:hypothetical protein [Lentzea sp. NPDC092896]|uniref:hypothetical protein n=1 Tax=Lentzea sp. NPDC092896 TaxID=3364127 RepID=UPI003820C776
MTAARRDNKQWARDQAHEDLRWQRDQNRVHAQRQHEVNLHWREARATTYSAALAVFDDCFKACNALLHRVEHQPLELSQFSLLDERKRVREIEIQLWERLASIELVATKRVRIELVRPMRVELSVDTSADLRSVDDPGNSLTSGRPSDSTS